MIGYIYDADSRELIAEITGEQTAIEQYSAENYDPDAYELTFSPAFGTSDGLVRSQECTSIDLNAIAKPGFWSAVDDGGATIEVEAETGEEAAHEYVDKGDWGYITETTWINMRVWQTTVSGERVNEEYHTITLEPDEPACESELHDWQEESVKGNGGGVIVADRCQNCGLERTTNTWAQNPATGEQGFKSVRYSKPDGAECDD